MTDTITMTLDEAKAVVAFCGRAYNRRNTIPILACMLFDGAGGVAMTDLDIWAEMTAYDTEGHAPFVLELDALKKLIAGAATGATVTIKPTRENVTLVCDGIETTAAAWDGADYPKRTPQKGADVWIRAKFDSETLSRNLTLVQPCISKEETRYYLNGVYLTAFRDCFSMVATDGRKLGMIQSKHKSKRDQQAGSIWPTKAVKLTHAAIGKDRIGQCVVSVCPSRVCVEGPGWSIESKVIDGTYPDFPRVLPSGDVKGALMTSPKAVAKVAKRLAGMVSERSAAGGVNFATGEIKANAPGGNSHKGTIAGAEVRIESTPVKGGEAGEVESAPTVGFNMHYFATLFDAADKAGVTEALIEASAPGEPCNIWMNEAGARLVVMPMRL